MNRFTFRHTEDPTIAYAHRRVKPAEFAEYWNGSVANGGRAGIVEQTNLCIAVRETPSADEFKALLDEEWSGLPADAAQFIAAEGGLFPLADNVSEDYGELVDVRALMDSFGHIPEDKRDEAIARSAKHIEALGKLGADPATIRSWNRKHPHLSRVVVALPRSIGGYYVGRIPRTVDRITAQAVQNANNASDESGPYAALCRFALDCCLWSAPMSVTGLIDEFPGVGARLGMIIRDIGSDSFKLELKK